MRASAIVTAALIVGFATSCSESHDDGDGRPDTGSSVSQLEQSDLVEAILDDAASTGLLAVRFRYAERTSTYAEGARHYLQVTTQDGTVVLRRDEGTEQGPGAGYNDSVQLQAGRYRVQTYQRGCDFTQGGDCERVADTPSGRCTADVVIRAEATTKAAITVPLPDPCTVKISGPA